jgi:hypothetical protein
MAQTGTVTPVIARCLTCSYEERNCDTRFCACYVLDSEADAERHRGLGHDVREDPA